MKILKASISPTIALLLVTEGAHLLHSPVHLEPWSHEPPLVHAPEEPLPDVPHSVADSSGLLPSGTIIEIRQGKVTSADSGSNGLLLATLEGLAFHESATVLHVQAYGVAVNSGTAGHFVVKNLGGEMIATGNINEGGSAAGLRFDNDIIVAGGTVHIWY